jgi:Na+/H+ antiporter NhaC
MIGNIDPGWMTLLPAAVTIFLAFLTRQVLLALFVGIVAGGLVYYTQTGNLSDLNIIKQFFLPAIGSETYAYILLIYLWSLGGLIGLWHKTGAARHFAVAVGNKIAKGPRTSKLFTWILGIIFHQGGTISTVLAGTTARPINDMHKVSHEEFAYVVDSTASPVATMVPFNAWPIYVAGLIVGTIPLLATEFAAFDMYIKALAFNFYAIFALLFTFLFSLELLPWYGKRLKAARNRARTTGKLDADDAEPLMKVEEVDDSKSYYKSSIIDFLLPLGTLLSMAIIPYVLGQFEIIPKNKSNWIGEAFMTALLVGMVTAKIRGMRLKDVLDGFVEGCQGVTIGAIVLGMAVTLGYVTQKIQLASFLIEHIDGLFPLIFLPGALTVLCLIVAFATGSSWGTFAVVLPVAIPLAYSFNPDPVFIHICLGSVLGGAVAGDQCSPISDTTVLASMTTGCDLIHHVKTQLPMAMMTIVLAVATSTAVTYSFFG